jgi:hypothetical protein
MPIPRHRTGSHWRRTPSLRIVYRSDQPKDAFPNWYLQLLASIIAAGDDDGRERITRPRLRHVRPTLHV